MAFDLVECSVATLFLCCSTMDRNCVFFKGGSRDHTHTQFLPKLTQSDWFPSTPSHPWSCIANFANTNSMGKVDLWPCKTHDWKVVIGRQGANCYDISIESQTPLKIWSANSFQNNNYEYGYTPKARWLSHSASDSAFGTRWINSWGNRSWGVVLWFQFDCCYEDM